MRCKKVELSHDLIFFLNSLEFQLSWKSASAIDYFHREVTLIHAQGDFR